MSYSQDVCSKYSRQYSNHLLLAFAPWEIQPPTQEYRLNSVLQMPFIQAFFTGFPWVATFMVLSAWVNAIKPLNLVKQGLYEKAAFALSLSVFRRVIRLMAPITVATTLTWFAAQFEVFQPGYHNSNGWLQSTSPRPSGPWIDALWNLGRNFYATWSEATNYYDKV